MPTQPSSAGYGPLTTSAGQPPWMAADTSSSTSHNTTSSRLPTSPALLPHQQPLSLADALAREGIHGDMTAALDAVLAERNKLCLEVAKLTGENVRIWHLLGRIRKDNDSLRSKVVELGGSPTVSSSGAVAAGSSPASSRRRGTREDIAQAGTSSAGPTATPSASTRSDSIPSTTSTSADPSDTFSTASASATTSREASSDHPTSALLQTSASQQGSASYMPRSPLSQSQWPSAEETSQLDTPSGSTEVTPTEASDPASAALSALPLASMQQSSIMQQRLLAQARSRPGADSTSPPGPDMRASVASQDFVAIEGSGSEDEGGEDPSLKDDVVIDPSVALSSAERSSGTNHATTSDFASAPFNLASAAGGSGWNGSSQPQHDRNGSYNDDQSITQHRYQQSQQRDVHTGAGDHQKGAPLAFSQQQQQPARSQHIQQTGFQPGDLVNPGPESAAHPSSDSYAGPGIPTRPSDGPGPRQREASAAELADKPGGSRGSGSGSGRGGAFGFAFAPWLDLSTLSRSQIRVVRSNIKMNDRNKESITFHVSIRVFAPASSSAGPSEASGIASEQVLSSWLVDKAYTDVVNLDARLRQKHGRVGAKKMVDAVLPDKVLFKDHAPSKVDARKAALEAYLMTLVTIQLPDKDDLITFLCTDVITPPRPHDPLTLMKEGHLTKKGQNLGRWVTRWYSLRGSRLEYFEAQGGVHLGGINIHGAQIGRQQKTPLSEADENSYRHAFLLLEKRVVTAVGSGSASASGHGVGSSGGGSGDGASQLVRHVLCAESDIERDEWVEVLVRAIAELERQSRRSAKAAMNGGGGGITGGSGGGGGGGSSVDSSSRRKQSDSLSRRNKNQPSNGRPGGPDVDGPGAPPSAGYQQHAFSGSMDHHDGSNGAVGSAPAMMPSSSTPVASRSEGGRLPDMRGTSMDNSHQPPSSDLQSLASQPHPPPSSSSASRERSNSLNTTTSGLGSSPSMSSATATHRTGARPSISGPMNGTPIPTGYKFGAKEDTPSSTASAGSGGGVGSNPSDFGSVGSPSGAAGGKTTDRDKKRFWHRFGGGADKAGRQEPRPVFGVSLSESIAISSCSEGLALPSVVYRCIEYLEKRNAATEEGIYRLSGSTAVIKALKDRFNTEGDVDLLAADHEHDPHAIAGLLKTFLRELPVNVLTGDLYRDFMRVNDLGDRKERVNELGQLVCMLPLPNYTLLRVLCSHLIKIIEHSDINKMTMRNVGIVFSPTLGIPGGLFALFLTEFDWVFYTDAQGDPAPRHMEEDILPPDAEELGNTRSERSIDHTGPSSGVPSTTGSFAEDMGRNDENGQLAPLSNRSGNRNAHRTSFVAGGTLSNMANVMGGHHSSGPGSAQRNKRNSLRYNEAEADRILGLHGRRLSTHIDESTIETGMVGYEDEPRDTGIERDPYADSARGGAAPVYDTVEGTGSGAGHQAGGIQPGGVYDPYSVQQLDQRNYSLQQHEYDLQQQQYHLQQQQQQQQQQQRHYMHQMPPQGDHEYAQPAGGAR